MSFEEDGQRDDEPVVIEVDRTLSHDQRIRIMNQAWEAWPERKVIVLEQGMRINRDERLDRIEAKLDALIQALAEDDEDRPTHDLDGHEIPALRTGEETL